MVYTSTWSERFTLTFDVKAGDLDRVSLDDFAKTMAINVEGPLFMTKDPNFTLMPAER